jgi:DNA mismatch endonuclease (patch repair protein)
VDGCFWHCCPIHGELPATNRTFWKRKLERNRKRDLLVNKTLRQRGWKVLRLWQHDLRDGKKTARRVRILLRGAARRDNSRAKTHGALNARASPRGNRLRRRRSLSVKRR